MLFIRYFFFLTQVLSTSQVILFAFFYKGEYTRNIICIYTDLIMRIFPSNKLIYLFIL
ncbi:hypothetical protein BDF21DRAFT_115262 [Thamnidium elegans]|nr:hypothetical protein BDF21DRAFT_115262 [Thamnidium elegans]